MRIIFLDIDGVVVTHRSWGKREHGHASADPRCVKALNFLCRESGAAIVVTSSWREGQTIAQLRIVVNQHFGVAGPLIGKTPLLRKKKLFPGMTGEVEVAAERGDEIDAWLNLPYPWRVESFVILDDDKDMGKHGARLVQTDFENGLTMTDALAALEILRQKR